MHACRSLVCHRCIVRERHGPRRKSADDDIECGQAKSTCIAGRRRILKLVSREWRAAVYFTKRTVYPQPNRKRCCPSVDPQTPGSGDRWDDGDAQSFRAFNSGAL
jgi:hypothetical protein